VSPSTVRRVVIAVCVTGIAGMIVTSIADSTGGALTFGLVTAAAVLGLILVTAVTTGAGTDEALAEQLEHRIRGLVERGADEGDVRSTVSDAVRLGRGRR
jgi:hypothetical protein